jgi:hypothetical protein
MISALKLFGMLHQPLMTAPPACQISRIRFARIPLSSSIGALCPP